MKENLWLAIWFLILGLMGPIGAMQFKFGKMKSAFLPLPINPAIPVDWPYAGLPIGLGSLLVGLGLIVDNRILAMIGLFGSFPFIFILMAWKPRWLKPDWLLWLEDRYSEPMLEFMFDQARKEKGWSQKVDTQAGLEAWAEEMEKAYRNSGGRGSGWGRWRG